ncbi:MAG: hypothetical protein EOP00_01005 [Pedobacter sp.]|nr:MAG: hypothetical protein EOP00_01005 [Pedobacter sp.]
MEISTLALKLIVLLFPGLVAALLYRRLTVKHKERSDFMFILIAITEGMLSYLTIQTAYFLGIFINNIFNTHQLGYEALHAFKDLSDSKVIPYGEIMCASLAAIIISIITVKVSHYNLLNKLAFKFKISNKYGDENLYSNFLNENCLAWVYVKDIPNEIVYLGVINAFSETENFKELVLDDVTVYQYFKDKEYMGLYDVPRVYLSFPNDKVIIEQAKIIETQNEERSENATP